MEASSAAHAAERSTSDHGPSSDTIEAIEATVPTVAKESRAVHRCEALKRSGAVCGRYIATLWHDGAWKCPSHRPRVKEHAPGVPGTPPKLPRPPVTDLKEPQDAVRLSSWAAIQAALGRLDHQRSNSIVAACREFRASWKAAAIHARTSAAFMAHLTATDAFFTADAAHDLVGRKAAAEEMQRILRELRADA